jgi:response regulator RpfG family c-di-GMP phosphodiesterase
MATKKKNLNASLDDLLAGLDLPTDAEVKEETGKVKRAEGVRANRDKVSEGVKKAFADPVKRAKHLKALADFAQSDEHKAKNKRAQKTRDANNQMEKVKAGISKMRNDPVRMAEFNKKNREGYLKAKDTPEYWEKYYEGIAKRDADPEYHKKRIAASNAKIAIKIKTPDGEFDSISDAARHYNMTSEGMRHRVNSEKYPDFCKIKK